MATISSGDGTAPKRRFDGKMGGRFQKKSKKPRLDPSSRSEGSHDEILNHELNSFFPEVSRATHASLLPPAFSEVQVKISHLSSTGDGLGLFEADGHSFVAVVPFSIPGDLVLAKTVRSTRDPQPLLTTCDFLKVIEPSPDRNDSLINCKYFAKCGGCQLQMLQYPNQLAHKRTIVERAFANFSELPDAVIPTIGETVGSPLQYGYRTKLTPHFDGPPGGRRTARRGEVPKFETVPPIGFMEKGTRKTIDIEECPIGTETVQAGLKRERVRVSETLDQYRRGATILLRESSTRKDDGSLEKACVTDHRGESREYVDGYIFENPANAFFQNNNSILKPFTEFIRNQVQIPGSSGKIKHLIDAYSGSGLFTITLHSAFENSIGIDISSESITFARRNAELNGVSAAVDGASSSTNAKNVSFLAGDANTLFASVPSHFKPEETLVILDPPRKGCDEGFLQQLVDFGPERIVYVSCNVHTQARDIGWFMKHARSGGEGSDGEVGDLYSIESIRGFDFFPQTGHVEGVAVLARTKQR